MEADAETILFFAGEAVIEWHRTETANYRDNLASAAPALWVIMRPTASDPPYELLAVAADPAEGETFTDAGSNLVEVVPMPSAIVEIIARFIAQHHVERPFVRRQRDQQTPPQRTGGRENARGLGQIISSCAGHDSSATLRPPMTSQ